MPLSSLPTPKLPRLWPKRSKGTFWGVVVWSVIWYQMPIQECFMIPTRSSLVAKYNRKYKRSNAIETLTMSKNSRKSPLDWLVEKKKRDPNLLNWGSTMTSLDTRPMWRRSTNLKLERSERIPEMKLL